MSSPRIPPLRIVKDFFALLRKEYSFKVTKQTTAKDIQKAISQKQSVTRSLADKKKEEYGLIKRWQHQKGFDERTAELAQRTTWSKSKTGKEYARISLPWTEPQKQFIREHSYMKNETLHQSFNRRFGGEQDGFIIEIRSKESISTMKSRMRRK